MRIRKPRILILISIFCLGLFVGPLRASAYYNLGAFWKLAINLIYPIWESGVNTTNSAGNFPASVGSGGTSFHPGARYQSVSWVSGGLFYLFGGDGYDSGGTSASLQDLWSYDPSTAVWTWVSGNKTGFGSGTYGTQYTPASGNKVGARFLATGITDSSGNLWFFGGSGYDSSAFALNNDLWKYTTGGLWGYWNGDKTPSTNGTCVAGSSKGDPDVGGTAGTFSSTYQPGSRSAQAMWIDKSNNIWIFGGYGCDSAGGYNYLPDLWKYDFSKGTNGQWAFMAGAMTNTGAGRNGSFSSSPYWPSMRDKMAYWTDNNGIFWLFGGDGTDSAGSGGYLNDLWKLDPTTATWTWVSSAKGSAINVHGIYGSKGVEAAANVPGARDGPMTWVDSSNNLWLYGGYGYDSAGVFGPLDDLWRYNPITNQWAWVAGHSSGGPFAPVYNTEGSSNPTNLIGSRVMGVSWVDSSGHPWIFGGANNQSSPTTFYDDMWKIR